MDTKTLIEGEKAFYKEAKALLKEKDDRSYFSKKTEAFNAAEKIAKTDEQRELLLNQYVQARHQLTFLLFRRKALIEDLANKFYDMITIEEANRRYADVEDERKARQDEESKRIAALREEENRLDIFKGVLSGMSEEKAKEELSKYQQSARLAAQGK